MSISATLDRNLMGKMISSDQPQPSSVLMRRIGDVGWEGTNWPDIGGGSGSGKTTYSCSETGSASTPFWRLSSVFEYISSSTQLRGSNVGDSPHSGVEDDLIPFLPHPPVQSHESN